MNNVHPILREAIAPFAPKVEIEAPKARPFEVNLRVGGKLQKINVLAFTACDAVVNAIDLLFDGEQPMPTDGLFINAGPMSFAPKAA